MGLESFPISLKMAAEHNLLDDLLIELEDRSIGLARRRRQTGSKGFAHDVARELKDIFYQTLEPTVVQKEHHCSKD